MYKTNTTTFKMNAIENEKMNVNNDDNDMLLLFKIIEKYEITLPEKLPAEYAGKSVSDAYLMARVKKEVDMKGSEKKLIRDIIKGAEKEERAAEKEAKKKALAEQKKIEKEQKKLEKQ